jgi:preprotein translocase subunit YajC
LETLSLLAQATQPTTQPGTVAPGWFQFITSPMGLILLIMVIFYFMVIRSKQRNERTRRQMLDMLKKGDEVQTIGGEFGKVVEAREDRVLLKVDESSNTKVWYSRSAINRVLSEEKAEAK